MAHTPLNSLLHRSPIRLVGFSLLLILLATLFPFNFSIPGGLSAQEFLKAFEIFSAPSDMVRNLFLFIPLGFGFANLWQIQGWNLRSAFGLTLVVCVGLSTTVEVLQVFLPGRYPSLTDILTNGCSGALGFWGFHHWRSQNFVLPPFLLQAARAIKKLFDIKILSFCFISYFILHCVIAISLQNATHLTNWDASFPLLVGNEKTGDRPWNGRIFDLQIANQTLLETQDHNGLIASYVLNGNGNYADQTGNSPDLVWQGQAANAPAEKGAFLNGDHWLATKTPVSTLVQNIRATSQFRVAVTLETADLNQRGPARIISLSADPLQRNLMLGQIGSDLVFRLRTPTTGENGKYPELRVANVFGDQKPHQLVVTYDGSQVTFLMDHQRTDAIALSPEITFFRYVSILFDQWSVYAHPIQKVSYTVLYYSIVFLPLGLLLGLIKQRCKRHWRYQLALFAGGIVLPVLLLQGILALPHPESWRWGTLALGGAIATVAMTSAQFFTGPVSTQVDPNVPPSH